MTDKSDNKPHQDKRVTLSPLTPDEALRAALQVKKADVDKLEAKDKAKKKPRKKK